MLTDLRPYITRRVLLPALTLALILAAILPFASDYRQLGQHMAQRYAEAKGQATAAAQANARAIEQGRAAEQERQRVANSYEGMAAAFVEILHRRRPPVELMVKNINSALEKTARAASQPGFYLTAGLRPEETSSRAACNDPKGTLEMLHREEHRIRNIFACGVYLALHRREIGEPQPHVTMALMQRVNDQTQLGYYPFQTIVTYVWLQHLAQNVNAGQPPGAFPDLNAGENYNPALFRGTLSPSFAQQLIDTATTEEKLDLSAKIYPDLKRMAELGGRIAEACKAMNRAPCLTSR